MCQTFNLSVEDLRYKWEALSFSNVSSLRIFTMDSVADLKISIQRDIAAKAAKIQKAQAKPSGNAARGRAAAPKFNQQRGPVLQPKAGRSMPFVKEEKGILKTGPTRVSFVGPPDDNESRQARSCECTSIISIL